MAVHEATRAGRTETQVVDAPAGGSGGTVPGTDHQPQTSRLGADNDEDHMGNKSLVSVCIPNGTMFPICFPDQDKWHHVSSILP